MAVTGAGEAADRGDLWHTILGALDANLDYNHDGYDDSCTERWEEAQYRDQLTDAVTSEVAPLLAALSAELDVVRAERDQARAAAAEVLRLCDEADQHPLTLVPRRGLVDGELVWAALASLPDGGTEGRQT